jgi:hypothetical protein
MPSYPRIWTEQTILMVPRLRAPARPVDTQAKKKTSASTT